jgi:adenylate cyclase
MQTLFHLWKNSSLRSKIAALTGILVIAAVLSLTILSIQRERTNFQKELVDQADLFLETTGLAMRDSIYRSELDELIDIAESVRDNPNVNRFLVFDAEGKTLVDTDQSAPIFSQSADPLGAELIELPADEMRLHWETDQLVAGRAVILGNQTIGAVATELSTSVLDQKIFTITWQGFAIAFTALVIASLITIWFSRQITQPLNALTRAAERMSNGDLSIHVTADSKDEIGRLSESFNHMVEGLQEREWLRDMFGRFVSYEVAEAMRSGKVNLEGENRFVSVLFCDIREFTDFSERHSPQEVVAMLNEFLPLVVQASQKHGGMVNKFGGDSTLIVYGAPHVMQDSAYRAVMTALEIRAGLKKMNARRALKAESILRVGVGINTGIALAGAVGPRERQEYTVVGNTVNLAARIDGLNKQYPDQDILISGWTYESLGEKRGLFDLASLGVVQIRGKHDPVEIWSVRGLK